MTVGRIGKLDSAREERYRGYIGPLRDSDHEDTSEGFEEGEESPESEAAGKFKINRERRNRERHQPRLTSNGTTPYCPRIRRSGKLLLLHSTGVKASTSSFGGALAALTVTGAVSMRAGVTQSPASAGSSESALGVCPPLAPTRGFDDGERCRRGTRCGSSSSKAETV